MLLYADDLVILGDHIGRVQTLLSKLNEFCFKWGFAINLAKTKAMVFRRGGVIKQNEHFYVNGQIIENVRHYKYLGVLLSAILYFSPCQKATSISTFRMLTFNVTILLKLRKFYFTNVYYLL